MSIPTYLPFTVLAGCVVTIVAVVVGVTRAFKWSNWSDSERRRTVQATASVLVGWFVIAVALALVGVYSAATSRIPTIQFGIAIPILIGCLMIWRWPAVSRLIDAVPRQWVIAIQFYRVEGVIFLVLFAAHRLPGLFALPAGLGDVAVGLLAAAIGIGATGGRQLNPRTVLRWNLLGIADLIVAVSTAFLTAPSAFQLFAFERPNELISMFPLVLIPTFLVPLAILLHIISLIQLGRATAHVGGARTARPSENSAGAVFRRLIGRPLVAARRRYNARIATALRIIAIRRGNGTPVGAADKNAVGKRLSAVLDTLLRRDRSVA